MVSIIIPIYNAEKKLERCINSILSQSYRDFELLLIDDGSTDNSSLICKKYKQIDSRIHFFQKTNSGASDTRNYGLKKVKGEYVTFSDADDWVEPFWLSSMVGSISNTDLVIQGFIKHENGVITKESIDETFVSKENYNCVCTELLRTAHMGYLWSMLFKIDIIKSYVLLLYTKMSFHEDLDFILRYLLHTNSFKTVQVCGYHYYYEKKHYFHNVSGCYSISMTLGKILANENLERYRKVYRTEAFNSLIFHKVSNYEIVRAKCYLKKFGTPCNGIKANIVSHILRTLPIGLIQVFIYILRCINRVK